jgi:hypothetical protein
MIDNQSRVDAGYNNPNKKAEFQPFSCPKL